MPREATSPTARIKSLAKAVEKAKSLKRGETLTSLAMSELLGVRWPTLREWCSDIPGFAASGAFDPGGMGIEWTFRPVKVVRFLTGHFQREVAARAAKAQRVRKIVGGNSLASAPDEYSIDELSKMIRLSSDVQGAKEKSGQLIDANRAASAIRVYHTSLQQAVLRAAQEQDPTGQWPPEIRESFEDATRTILLRMEQAGEVCLRQLRGGTA